MGAVLPANLKIFPGDLYWAGILPRSRCSLLGLHALRGCGVGCWRAAGGAACSLHLGRCPANEQLAEPRQIAVLRERVVELRVPPLPPTPSLC